MILYEIKQRETIMLFIQHDKMVAMAYRWYNMHIIAQLKKSMHNTYLCYIL